MLPAPWVPRLALGADRGSGRVGWGDGPHPWAGGEHPAPEQTWGRKGTLPGRLLPDSPMHPLPTPCGPQRAAPTRGWWDPGIAGEDPAGCEGRGSKSWAKILVLYERVGGVTHPPWQSSVLSVLGMGDAESRALGCSLGWGWPWGGGAQGPVGLCLPPLPVPGLSCWSRGACGR